MSAKAAVTPACSPSQYHRASRPPANSTTPVVTTTGKAATPMIGLGKPRRAAWADSITLPQLRTGLMLQVGT